MDYRTKKLIPREECYQAALEVAHSYQLFLNTSTIPYSKDGFVKKLAGLSYKYQLTTNDMKKILNILESLNIRYLQNENNFWAYLTTVFKYPPIEPDIHFLQREGITRITPHKWRILMDIKKDPQKAENPENSIWALLAEDEEFAEVYEQYATEAIIQLDKPDTTTKKRKETMILGKTTISKDNFWEIDFETLLP